MRDRLIFFLLRQIRLEGCKKYPNCYYQFIPTKSQLKLNTFLLKLVTVLGRTISSFYCNCLLFLQQLPKALYVHYHFKHADISIASLEMVMSL